MNKLGGFAYNPENETRFV